MGEVKVLRLTDSQIGEAVRKAERAIPNFPVKVPVDRVKGEPPGELRLETKVTGGVIVFYANVYGADEVSNIIGRSSGLGGAGVTPRIETEWELWCKVPELLGGAAVGKLRIGHCVELPLQGVTCRFKVTVVSQGSGDEV